jgi:CubicO group peptidase (beta-lactamase class C family)
MMAPRRAIELAAVLGLLGCSTGGQYTELLRHAAATNTTSLVIWQDGTERVSWTRDGHPQRPVPLMSVTKSICSLAIGTLLDDRRLPSLEVKLARYFPAWQHSPKQAITLRQVLSQTAGFADPRVDFQDVIAQAIDAPLSYPPGSRFFYSNMASNLVSATIVRISGMRTDAYVARRIFAPLGIASFAWKHDGSSNIPCDEGLALSATDLAKVGQMMLDGGTWHGRRVVSSSYLSLATHSSQDFRPDYGLLWWMHYQYGRRRFERARIDALARNGVDRGLLAPLYQLSGRTFDDEGYYAVLERTLGSSGRKALLTTMARTGLSPVRYIETGQRIDFSAEGAMGQYLAIVPNRHLIVVRLIAASQYAGPNDDFEDFWSVIGE